MRVHADDWSYAGCPHGGPALATGGDGVVHVAWYTGKLGQAGMYYARSSERSPAPESVALITGDRMGPSHPVVAALPDGGALAAYDLTAKGERRIGLALIQTDGSISERMWIDESDGGSYPQLAVLGERSAILAWTQPAGSGTAVRLVRVTLTR
jgi:hypothetical protein